LSDIVALYTKVNHSRVLHEIRLFIETETQRSVLHHALQNFQKTISIRYIDIEKRLTSVLEDAEVCKQVSEHLYLYSTDTIPPGPISFQQCITKIRAGISMSEAFNAISSAQSQALSSNLMNSVNADVVRRSIGIYRAIIYGTHILSFLAVKCFQMPMIL
jgi:hypothetical protein